MRENGLRDLRPLDDCLRPYFGMTPYIPAGRQTFLALVPARYLRP